MVLVLTSAFLCEVFPVISVFVFCHYIHWFEFCLSSLFATVKAAKMNFRGVEILTCLRSILLLAWGFFGALSSDVVQHLA